MADSSFEKLNVKLDEWSKFKVGMRYERRTYLDIFLTAGVGVTAIPLTVFGIISIVSQDYFGASYWFLMIAIIVAALMLVKVTSRRQLERKGELHFVVLDIHTGASGAMDYLVRFDNGVERSLIEYDRSKVYEPVHNDPIISNLPS
jgi:hypothetical protein